MDRPLVRALLAALLLETVVFCASTVPGVRSRPGFDTALDGWLQGTAYVTTALVALAAMRGLRRERLIWWLVAAALALRAVAFVLFLGFVRYEDPQPYPSISDVFWLASAALLLAALAVLSARRARRMPANLLLDALVGALATCAVALTLLDGTLHALTRAGLPADVVITNVAYPALDVALMLLIVGVLAAYDWRPPPALWCLAAGILGFAVTDCVFLFQVTEGTFRPGTILSALTLVSTVLIALAPTLRMEGRLRERTPLPTLVLPLAFAGSCLAVLVYGAFEHVPAGAVLLATAGLVVAISRTALTFHELRTIAEIRREARTDELTGLGNRRAFNERLERLLAGRRGESPLALLILDLDDFKIVNDTFGHHQGDELLVQLAPRFRVSLRSDDFLARIGGDEFAVILDGADDDRARRVAERILAALRRPFALDTGPASVTGSVGIARFPTDATEASELLRLADLAMYGAKHARLGTAFFDEGRDQRHPRSRPETVDRIRDAIAEQQLVVHYQPIVSLADGRVQAVEALVRWEHPEEGLLAPAAFLPQVETGGLMGELTREVLRQALDQVVAWADDGDDVQVSVNLSVTNLLDERFPDQVSEMLAERGLTGTSLVLELTEDLFLADPDRGRRVLGRLLASGVRMVIDDYGTGYSSLGYLRDLPGLGGLKLDRSFVHCVETDPRCEAIVASTVALAEALSLTLVAEGVETAAVRDRLLALGCRSAQGYLFGRPGPAALIELP